MSTFTYVKDQDTTSLPETCLITTRPYSTGLDWDTSKVRNVQILHIVALTLFTLFTFTLIPTFYFKYFGKSAEIKSTTRLLKIEILEV